jgi:peptidoglycan/LPS O-acetylase OafA/YrhL
LSYQPALDGVRALAVLAVLLFHAGVRQLSGGFLGVDAFFVLSGFLITSLLLAELARNGKIALAAFWLRRARRLLPALVVVLAVVALLARTLAGDEELTFIRGDALAALAYVANWRMIFRGTDYFAQTAAPSPLQHTWSLGIEEQFYLCWPLIVLGVMVFAARRGRAVLLALAVAGAAGSAIAGALLFRDGDVGRAYFGTDTRAQALLIGCALALALKTPRARMVTRTVSTAAAVLGLGVIAMLWAYADGTDAWLYRGGLTAGGLAVAAVLWHVTIVPAGPLSRALSVAPLVAIGKISYGVYLWHWPLFQLLNGDRTGLAGAKLIMLRITAALVVATLSYWVIERPFRRGVRRPAWLAGRRAAIAGATAFAVVVAGTVMTVLSGTRSVTVSAAPVIVLPTASDTGGPAASPAPMRRAGRKPGGQPRVTILGDSVAWSIGTYLPDHPGLAVTTRAIQGCGIALLPDILAEGTPHTNYPHCERWPDRWRSAVVTDDPDVAVILLNRWELMDRRINGRYQHVGQPDYDAYLLGQLAQGVGIAVSHGAQAVLLTAAYTRRNERPDGGIYPEDEPSRVDAWNRLLGTTALRFPGRVTVLDLNAVACPDGRFTWDVDGLRIRSDGLHFTPVGVQRIIAPWLLPQVARIAVAGPPPRGLATARPDRS